MLLQKRANLTLFPPSHRQVTNHHTSSMSSLNSQESSNDICKLTDKQQAEYRDAYREYIAQMAQLEMSGGVGERPVQPHPGHFLQASAADDKGVGLLSRHQLEYNLKKMIHTF